MADSDELYDPHLSIVPYDTNREVVLRHADSVVVFDPQSRQLILRNRNRGIERPTTEDGCPHCGRPYDHNNSSAVDDDYADEQQPSFINNEYFRMLASSLPSSNRSSRPPSPRRQLAQPVRSPLSSTPLVPPPEAEFVGSSPAPLDPAHGISESAFAPNYFEKFFVVEKELGRGGRGVVLLVRHVLDEVALGHFACKRVPVGDDHAWLEKVLVEVQALQSLSHQNLVSYRHVWLQDYQTNSFSPSVPCAFILQQYCNGGDLHSYVCGPAQVQTTAQDLKERMRRRSKGEGELPRKLNEPRKLNFDQIYSFFLDITEGLRFLHLNGFIHRDLKPSNCLIHRVGGETRILVSDFGEVQYENAIRKSTGHTGTISYCAPEVLKPVSPGGPLGNFSFKSDIFSLGMILHFLCFADLPYHSANVLQEDNEDLDELRDEITSWLGFDERRRDRPDLPSKLYAVLKQLLSISPEGRPTADDIRNAVVMGHIDFAPELKRRSSQTGPEDLTPGKRITKIDSPATGNTSKPLNRPRDIDAMSPSRQAQMRRRGPRSPSLSGPASGAASPRMSSEEFDDSTNQTALMMRRSSSHGITQPPRLNPRPYAHVSNSTSPESPRKQINSSPERQRQLLLPPPREQSLAFRMRTVLYTRVATPSFYILIFAAKLMSVIQPCLSHGLNSNLFYVTFLLAAMELATFPHPLWRAVVLAGGHAGILWYASEKGMWCRSGWRLED
ncbi:putative serine/threonine-protein kinase iks1 [Knufia obscura]|uniref:Serine/threonine-protein kinase iks1 n=1 Tax=Knufia obscura TaxID=1635080 RepID=A0ABR0R8V0_9EURO|nr:putative serine/threonine-protein kinase iks1 [Knufia obscura]